MGVGRSRALRVAETRRSQPVRSLACMTTYVVRVWLPDRPGAFGAVASRIGAVGGDIVGIDILERGAGRAIDEIHIDLPDDDPARVVLMAREISQVDGVDVEDIRPADGASLPDSRVDALETAALIVAEDTAEGVLEAVSLHAQHDFAADWVAVVETSSPSTVSSRGNAPLAPWLCAFVEGGSSSAAVAAGESGPDDVAWAPLDGTGLAVVLGRDGRPLRARERRQLLALARIAALRHRELGRDRSRWCHPSAGAVQASAQS